MSLSSLSSTQLERLVRLIKEKEALQSKLSSIERSLDSFGEGEPRVLNFSAGGKPRRRRRKTTLKDGILKKLHTAGKKGLTVSEMAQTLKANHGSVSVWFYTTGKNIKEIRKIGKAKYAYVSS
jgi:hypothetical protein